LISKPEIKKVEDLKGKKVGISGFGTGLEVYTRIILQKHGLTPNDVTFIANGSHSQAFASLESGQVDATIIHEPFVTLGETTGKARLLAKGWDYLPTFHTGVLTASSQFINKQPELVAKMIRAYFKSQEYAKSHPDEYLDYAMKNVKIDRAVLAEALKKEKVLWENNPDVNIDALNDTQRIQLEQGFQDKSYDLGKILDLRFIAKK
jgi:ABC-type nitrate/sulfonate/bicarbonate transport system substrate-binding protein